MSVTANATCPECDARLRADGDETVCSECGLVVAEDRIDRGPEWRSLDDEGADGKRTGAPLTRSRHDRGLSTEIGHRSGATRLTGRKRRRVARLRREHNRARISTKRDRNKVYAFTEIRRIVGALSLPDAVQENACSLFTSAQNEDLLQGRSLEGFAAACVYAACRAASVSRTLAEVVGEAKADEAELRAAYDALNADLGLPVGPVDPREYLPRFASRLSLPPVVEREAHDLAAAGEAAGLVNGRNPCGFAVACLYRAALDTEHQVTQAEAAEVGDVSPVTLRSAHYDLEEVTD